jgi:hypothetical protein
METATSAAIAIKTGRRRRDVLLARAWLLDSSILCMDFQPILSKKKFGFDRLFRPLSYGGDFGGCNLAREFVTRMLFNVVQCRKCVNETIFSVQFLAYQSNAHRMAGYNQHAIHTPRYY